MKRIHPKYIGSFVAVLLLCALSPGQISDEDAIGIAKKYLKPFVSQTILASPRLLRESMPVRGSTEQKIGIYFQDATVFLNEDGSLSGLSIDGSAADPRTEQPEKFKSDEEAWLAMAETLRQTNLVLPPNLERHSLTKGKQGYNEYVYTFYMRPRPYGYGNSSGNYVSVQLNRVTGALRHVSLATGWTYEEPNLQISHKEAIQAALGTLGGAESEWTGKQLRYCAVPYERAPEYLRALLDRQVMRLMYIISSGRGSVMIDSVTGQVLDSWQSEGSSVSVSRSGDMAGSTQTEGMPRKATVAIVVVAALLLVFGVAFQVVNRRRA